MEKGTAHHVAAGITIILAGVVGKAVGESAELVLNSVIVLSMVYAVGVVARFPSIPMKRKQRGDVGQRAGGPSSQGGVKDQPATPIGTLPPPRPAVRASPNQDGYPERR